MEACSTLRAAMPPDGQAFSDQNAAARTPLAGERRINRCHSSTGACCLVSEDDQECAPPRVLDAFGEVMILEHVGRLHVLMIDRIVLLDERQRRLVVKVSPLAFDF